MPMIDETNTDSFDHADLRIRQLFSKPRASVAAASPMRCCSMEFACMRKQ